MSDQRYFTEKVGRYEFQWVFIAGDGTIRLNIFEFDAIDLPNGRIRLPLEILELWSLAMFFHVCPIAVRQRKLKMKAIRKIRKREAQARAFNAKKSKFR